MLSATHLGMPSEDQAIEIVHYAVRNGVTSLDTAHMYALSQQRVGKALAMLNQGQEGTAGPEPAQKKARVALPHVVTKLNAAALEKCTDAAAAAKVVDESIENSKKMLQMDPLGTMCLHIWSKHGPSFLGGAAWNRLKHHKKEGTRVRADWQCINKVAQD